MLCCVLTKSKRRSFQSVLYVFGCNANKMFFKSPYMRMLEIPLADSMRMSDSAASNMKSNDKTLMVYLGAFDILIDVGSIYLIYKPYKTRDR